MLNRLLLAATLVTLASPVRAQRPAAGTWQQLFNGRDLEGWVIKFKGHPLGENVRNTFRVQNGLLQVNYDQWTGFAGEFGHIFYRQRFSHYIVAAEYRFVGNQVTGAASGLEWAIRNNGIMVHSQSPESMGLDQDFPMSLEVQLLGGLGRGPRSTGNLCTPGTNVHFGDTLVTRHCINSTSKTYDGDQWVRAEAMVLGDSIIKHIVNGDTVMVYRKPEMGGGSANEMRPGVKVDGTPISAGYIALQAETAPIEFRKVELLDLTRTRQASRPVLAVFAHPDDERVVGPLLSRWGREGREVHLVIATDGSKGIREHAGIPAGPALATARTAEAKCAADRLGVRQLHQIGLEDGGLASFANLGRLRTELANIVTRLQPAAIITIGPEGGTGHPDHRLVGNVVTQIVQSPEHHRTIDLLYASLPAERLRTAPPAIPTVNGMAEELLTVRLPFESRDLVAGQESFACHRTQYTTTEMQAINRYLAHAWNGTVFLRPWNGALRDPGGVLRR